MLVSTNHTKPLHFFRRFVEGWFSVYLSIFLLTLAIRLLFFAPDTDPANNRALSHLRIQTRHILQHGFRHVQFSPTTAGGVKNAASFGAVNP